jgi:hypothetical protein
MCYFQQKYISIKGGETFNIKSYEFIKTKMIFTSAYNASLTFFHTSY